MQRGLLLALALVLGACSRREGDAEHRPNGAWLYGRSCAGCHGPTGKGAARMGLTAVPRDLSDPAFERSDAELKRVIREGKGEMPPFGKVLPEAELEAIVRHLHTLKSEPAQSR
jgi:mono/diheme cytochrome c family protein